MISEEPHASDPGGEAGAEHQRGRERRQADARRQGAGALAMAGWEPKIQLIGKT